jgi:16S rRNA (guanine966-N2)-methyltransferase
MKLRIISGTAGGRFINVPKSDLIRPTTDRVRETLFNLLNNRISFEGIKVLDLYAGSGSLGLECFSRGADEIHFVENNYTIYTNLDKNIKTIGAEKQCIIYKMTAIKFSNLFKDPGYDLIIADPPFFKDDIYKVIENLFINKYINKEGLVIIERSIQTKNKDIEHFKTEPIKIIGDNCIYELKI